MNCQCNHHIAASSGSARSGSGGFSYGALCFRVFVFALGLNLAAGFYATFMPVLAAVIVFAPPCWQQS